MKMKWDKDRRERARRKAENDPSARRLRELVDRGRAELEARRRAEGRSGD
jgi:hypothetical protein